MRLNNYIINLSDTIKISLLNKLSIFVCIFVVTSSVLAKEIIVKSESNDTVENYNQLFLNNEYVIEQLTGLLHKLKKQPGRMGSQVSGVDTSLLVFKLNSLNYLMASISEVEPDFGNSAEGITTPTALGSQELLLQSRELMSSLPGVFHRFGHPDPIDFDQYATAKWYSHNVTRQHLYKQLLQIESLMNGLKTIVKPEDVYQVIFSTQALLSSKCENMKDIPDQPLIMGKESKDVYLHLLDYLGLLLYSESHELPFDRPARVLPHDVFDLAVVSLAYSSGLLSEEDYSMISIRSKFTNMPPVANDATILTPSHVYKAVSENIALLECERHASH